MEDRKKRPLCGAAEVIEEGESADAEHDLRLLQQLLKDEFRINRAAQLRHIAAGLLIAAEVVRDLIKM